MIPVHPTAGPDPRTVRWHVPPGTLTVRGTVTSLPERLTELVEDGLVTRIVTATAHVDVTLAGDATWSVAGARVRSALLADLGHPDEWYAVSRPAGVIEEAAAPGCDGPGGTADADAELRAAALALLDGDVGGLARSHGGALALESVQDGVVTVRMGGACSGCPAASVTLHARFERDLRAACPDLREVRGAGGGPGERRLRRILERGQR